MICVKLCQAQANQKNINLENVYEYYKKKSPFSALIFDTRSIRSSCAYKLWHSETRVHTEVYCFKK